MDLIYKNKINSKTKMETKTMSQLALFAIVVYIIATAVFCLQLYADGVSAYGEVYKEDLRRNAPIQFNHLMNTYREKHDTNGLAASEGLMFCATQRAAIIYSRDEFSHKGAWDSYCNQPVHAENLAKNHDNISALRAWVLSEEHNDILLSDVYSYYGLGNYGNITVMLLS